MPVFFFKQKSACELRISDWSSDVCSSDLGFLPATFTNTNAYRQTYAVAVRQTGTGILEGLVFAGGGRAIEAKRLGLIAGLADDGMLVSPLSPTTVSGAYGSRQIPLAPYRSEERRVGKECGSTGRSRGWPEH